MVGMNRLSRSTSPYLLQHADNPVDWWEWSDEALAEARRRDVPILLSVGYAACHWCHVMAHDSFENKAVAVVMNANYVNIKVDREERPDIDAVYMDATTALTGQGGWPMTCLLTPDGAPFYAGTFFPRQHFVELLTEVARLWREQREDVLAAGSRVVAALAQGAVTATSDAVTGQDLDAAIALLARLFDPVRGGFGGAPKFPPSMTLEFLLRHHERTGDPTALAMAEQTLTAMARGGLYDQLAGGFARYCVDANWVVPHFEKMLYDNAQLARVYLHWWRLTADPLAERVARETLDFMLADLLTPQGGFASSLDADTHGVEGLTYVWTPAELREALGDVDGEWAAEVFGVTAEGTFEEGASTLQLRHDPEDAARLREVKESLRAERAQRPQPGRDDKVVAAWNGLAVAAFAEAAMVFAEPRYLGAAARAAHLLAEQHVVDGRLRRSSRDGRVGAALAVAEDYGNVADGVLALFQASGEVRWLEFAASLLDFARARFDDGAGGFYDTADDAEQLVRRPKDPGDNASPSGNSALITALVGYGALTGSVEHLDAARSALAGVAALLRRQPRFGGHALAAAEALADGPVQIAVVGDDPELIATAWRHRPPGAVVVAGSPNADGIALLAGRPLVRGGPAAYVCRGMVCDLPVSTPEALARALEARPLGS
jgi:uncharacterized protein YyaL (SSP411 family)